MCILLNHNTKIISKNVVFFLFFCIIIVEKQFGYYLYIDKGKYRNANPQLHIRYKRYKRLTNRSTLGEYGCGFPESQAFFFLTTIIKR